MPPWHGAGPSYERVSKCGGPRGRINPALFRALIPRTTLQGLKHKSQHKKNSAIIKSWQLTGMDDKHFISRLLSMYLPRIIDKNKIKLGTQRDTCLILIPRLTIHVIYIKLKQKVTFVEGEIVLEHWLKIHSDALVSFPSLLFWLSCTPGLT